MDKQIKTQGEISLADLKSGDKAAFAQLVETYSNPIYRLAVKILNDQQDAEDVLQETFIKAYRSLPEFEGRSSLSTWLYRIAVNEALMIIRKRHPEAALADEAVDEEESVEKPVELVNFCCLPERELLSAEARKFLDKAISQLPENLRVVFLLRDVEGFSIQETAETLKISEANVKTRLLRARLRLREALSGYFGERMPQEVPE
jgi:RNA polymerase sigma-70 factor (ECF subfamily)